MELTALIMAMGILKPKIFLVVAESSRFIVSPAKRKMQGSAKLLRERETLSYVRFINGHLHSRLSMDTCAM